MAVSYKVLGQVKPTADTATTLYTVPTGAGNYSVVSTLCVTSLTDVHTNIRIAVRPAGETLADKHYILYNNSLGGLQSKYFTIGITLNATDVVTVYDSAGSAAFSLFGSENS
jgi:hypothetical protein